MVYIVHDLLINTINMMWRAFAFSFTYLCLLLLPQRIMASDNRTDIGYCYAMITTTDGNLFYHGVSAEYSRDLALTRFRFPLMLDYGLSITQLWNQQSDNNAYSSAETNRSYTYSALLLDIKCMIFERHHITFSPFAGCQFKLNLLAHSSTTEQDIDKHITTSSYSMFDPNYVGMHDSWNRFQIAGWGGFRCQYKHFEVGYSFSKDLMDLSAGGFMHSLNNSFSIGYTF